LVDYDYVIKTLKVQFGNGTLVVGQPLDAMLTMSNVALNEILNEKMYNV